MTNRLSALAIARRGLRVFRLKPGSKKHFVDRDWVTSATSHCADVFDMWAAKDGSSADYNIGVLCSGMCVIDVDAHKGGLDSLPMLGDLPETLTVRTPRGGLHLFFKAENAPNSIETLAPGIDVRGRNGYVVTAGSTFEGKPYIVEKDLPVADAPASLIERVKTARAKSEVRQIGEVDTPEAIQRATEYLASAEPATEGASGDAHTYKVCCRVMDFGLSVPTAYEAMQGWDDKCSPPWGEELLRKLENAASYRQNPIGSDDPIAGLGAVDFTPSPDDCTFDFRELTYTDDELATMPREQWIIPGWYQRGEVTCLAAPGGSGKSLLTIVHAVAIALGGLPAMQTLEVREKTRVAIINAEDRYTTAQKRLAALCLTYGLDQNVVGKNLRVHEWGKKPFRFFERVANGVTQENAKAFRDLELAIKTHGFGLVILDPLAKFHGLNENDNSEMSRLMAALSVVAQKTNCAICIVHHTNKPAEADSHGRAGNGNVLRGASAIHDSVRIVKTLFTVTEEDAAKFGIGDKERLDHMRIDDAKANHARRSSEATILKKLSVDLPNGDNFPTIQSVDTARRQQDAAGRMAQELAAFVEQGGDKGRKLQDCVDYLSASPMWCDYAPKALASNVRAVFGRGAVHVGSLKIRGSFSERSGSLFAEHEPRT